MRNMRTPLLAGLLALLIPACTDGISDIGGGGDDTGGAGATCGNGAVESGEACDDGNVVAGDGCSDTCASETSTPRLNMSADKTTISTELRTMHPITLTLNGVGGFGETVNLTASVVDATDTPLAGWMVTLASPSVEVPTNGMTTVVATLKVPSVYAVDAGKVKIVATSSLGTQTVTTDVAVANQITWNVKVDAANGGCIYPAAIDGGNQASPILVKIGTKIRFFNDGATDLVVHTNSANGVTHQDQLPNGKADPVTEVNTAYELPLQGPVNGVVDWYCHSPSDDPGQANRPQFKAQ
jgi:cysteine-rich repeat protein